VEFTNLIKEALLSLRQNKSRSILAGFGVTWGIFILILLLGTGRGFQQGILQLFSSFAKNSIWVYGGQVSETSLKKTTQRKLIVFDQTDLRIIKERFPEIEFISPELNYSGNSLTSYQQNTAYPQIRGVLSDYFNVKIIEPEGGRLLNVLDNKDYRRVAVIGSQVADLLFPTEAPIGKSINISGTYFTVIGIIEKGSIFTQNEQNVIYIPYNSFIDCFNQGREFNAFILTLSKKIDAIDLENKIKTFLGRYKGFDVDDKKAIFILNFENQTKAFDKLFKGINGFLWFVGISLLLSGIAGISNIMFVIVKERTFEIGIRKAVGATSRSIIGMIITESVVITSMAGLIGLSLGVLVISLLNWTVASFFNAEDFLFTEASTDFPVIIFSLFILILAGVLAGFLPAKKASEISPVEAIRQENL
jgi:putative ABC transport system permease protein